MYSNNSNYGQMVYPNTVNYPYQVEGQNDDRFVGGLLAPLFLGGVAGYAIGYNRPNYNQGYAPMPYPYQVPVYTNNYYYPYY